jgi:hypothetical protein
VLRTEKILSHNFNEPGTNLRKKLQKFRIQIFVLSILLSFFLAYGLCDGFGNIYFLSTNPILENFDQDDLSLDPPDQLKAITSDSFSSGKSSLLGIYSFKDFLSFPLQAFFVEQKDILRC